jgi:CubicO group peptidase (beta-lactamase class C family)
MSVTKMFTAATVVSLAQQGVLDLQRPIATYLSELAPNSELGTVTLHQLLTHTAGLVDDPHHSLCEGGAALSNAITQAHLGARPGTVYLYSNIGYSLAGLVIERATSRPFQDVVRERVLLPMDMTSATFDFTKVQLRGHPEGAGARSRCPLAAPAGGLIASVRDLARWARAMSEPSSHPLGQPLVDTLTRPYVETGARPDESYGYGVWRTRRGNVWVYHHGGEVQDFSSYVAWVPEKRLGSATAMNLGRGAMVNTIGGTLGVVVLRELSVLLDLPDDWRPNVEGSPRPLNAYVGTYVDRKSWLGRVRVRLDGERLALDYLDGPPALLPPSFAFRFVPGQNRARFVVTVVGVGERVADE